MSTPSKPGKGKSGGSSKGLFFAFAANLARVDLYKPMQGWYARVYTAIGLGLVVAAGAWKIYEASLEYQPLWRFGIPAAFAAILGWMVFRIVHFPPFAEFLIATEAEMNKVSWTSKDDLIRATTVVLTTVVLDGGLPLPGRHALDFHPSNDRSASVHRRRRIGIDGLKRPADGQALRASEKPAGATPSLSVARVVLGTGFHHERIDRRAD